MAEAKPNEALPIALSTWGGFLATLVILLVGTWEGTRAWILLIRAGAAFLLVSGFLKLFTAGVMQVIQAQGRSAERAAAAAAAEVTDTAALISSAANSPETSGEGTP
jgi:hypothetical protein